jgi:subtilase family serine protease
MLKASVRRFLLISLTAGLLAALAETAFAQAADLISQPVNAQQVLRLNDVHPLAQAKYETGRLPASTPLKRMILTLKINPAQKAALDEFVRQTTDRTSSNYHKWLTPAQFGEMYGPSTADIAKVTAWLTSQGFSIDKVGTGRTRIEFSGTAGQVEAAFQTEMHTYKVKGEAHIANSIPSAIPQALAPVVAGVHSLNDFFSKPVYTVPGPNYTSPSGQLPAHLVTPADFAAIYDVNPLYKQGIDGTGQTIGIIGRSNISLQDIAAYRSLTGLPPINLNVIIDGPDPGLQPNGDESEQIMDVSLAGAVAYNAAIDLIISQTIGISDGTDLASAFAVDNNLAPILSESYSRCEGYYPQTDAYDLQVHEQAAAQGITFIQSSGDSGPAQCDADDSSSAAGGYAVNAMASTPYNVAVGGTMFNDAVNPSAYWSATNSAGLESALGYIPEVVWDVPGVVVGSGGGASILYSKPAWQTGPGVPNDGARDIPDVSFLAGGDTFYLICEADAGDDCTSGFTSFFAIGGTSASAPSFAGIMALVNQQTGSIQGNADPAIYAMANNAALYTKAFHDITEGSNDVPTVTGGTIGFDAGPGYDLATGWGSLDVYQFVTNFQAVGSQTSTLVISANQTTVTHGQDVSFNLTLSAASGSAIPTGDVAFFATNSAGTQSIGIQSCNGSSNTWVFDTAGNVPGGKLTIYARYGGDANFAPSTSNSVTVQVNRESATITVVSSANAPYDPTQPIVMSWGLGFAAYIQAQGSSTGDASPTGTVNVLVNSASQGSVSLISLGEVLQESANINGFSINSNTLPVGSYSMVLDYSGDLAYLPSTSPTYTIQVTQTNSMTVAGVDKSAPLVNSVVNIQAFVDEPGVYIVDATGSVTFTDNGKTIGQAPLPAASTILAGNSGYLAVFPYTITTAGTHVIQAVYSGDQNVTGSASPVFTLIVAAKSSTASILTKSGDISGTIGAGGSEILTDTVIGNSNGPVPTGTVIFSDGGTPISTQTLAAGVATLTTTTLSAGQHEITAAYGGDANFQPSDSATATLTVATFTLGGGSSSLSVQAGSATSAASITATDTTGFFYFFNAIPIAFTCGGLPSGASCFFNPSTANFGSPVATGLSTAATSLTITTQGPTLVSSATPLQRPGSGTRTGFGATGSLALAALLLCVPFMGKRARKLGLLVFLAAVITVAGISGCGGGVRKYAIADQGTPAGTYPVTITATAGPTVVTTTINLTVTSEIQTY